MRRRLLGLLFLLLSAVPFTASAAGTQILLVARDHEDRLLSGFRFMYQGIESKPTNQAGVTELDLPPEHRPGQQIKLHLVVPTSKQSEEWFLVDPMVNLPAPHAQAEVVLMRRNAFRQFTEKAFGALQPAASEPSGLTAEEQRRVLVEVAKSYGLTAEQVEAALRSFAETENLQDRGIVAYLEGDFSRSEEILEVFEKSIDAKHVEALRYLGAAQYEQGKYLAAADTFRKAVALRGDDPALLSWFGEVLHQLAEWEEAERMIRGSLAIQERALGADHPELTVNRSNLAALLMDTGRFAEAEPLMRDALATEERNLGPDDPSLTPQRSCMASLLGATKRRDEAEAILRRVVEIGEKSLPNNSRRYAVHLGNLASLLVDKGRLTDAEPLMRRALKIAEESFGSDHPAVANILCSLGSLLQQANRSVEAEPFVLRALAIDEKRLGVEHPGVARDLSSLASLYKASERFDDAEPLMRRALDIYENSFGIHHPKVAVLLDHLAHLLQATDRFDEAEPLLRRALDIEKRHLGPLHPKTAILLSELALSLEAGGRIVEAEPLMLEALEIFQVFEFREGRQHSSFLTTVLDYIGLLQEMGKPETEIGSMINALVNPVRR